MKKSSRSKTNDFRQKTSSGYSTSGDDSHNNSIYQIRTNHHKKSIPYKNSLAVDSQPSIVWVHQDKPDYEPYRLPGDPYISSAHSNNRDGTVLTENFSERKSSGVRKSDPREVHMVMQARGSPPVESATKILSKDETKRPMKRSPAYSSKTVKDSSVSTRDLYQPKKRGSSVVYDRLSPQNSDRVSLASGESPEDPQWHHREQCGPPHCPESYYEHTYSPEQSHQQHHHQQHYHHQQSASSGGEQYDVHYTAQAQGARSRRSKKRTCQQSCVPEDTQETQQIEAQNLPEPREVTQSGKSDVGVNKNYNDSKACDCCMETPKTFSTIYICQKHPGDSRTYCCKEVVEKDIKPRESHVYVSPSCASRRSGCERVHHESPTLKRRQSCCTCTSQAQVSRPHPSHVKPSEDCRCVRKNTRKQCSSKCTEAVSKFLSELGPRLLSLLCLLIKLVVVMLLYLLLLGILSMYTSLNHWAHLTIFGANIFLLFILFFEPNCLVIDMFS
ncbi:hypothetical protein BgiMline_006284 [Biomphalaria glabrata]|uniref:Uncharacterized protein LOC106061834 n=1 Tax=Biomphalaria glabrata TaxID=6526 RepID=A0A9U8E7Z8_BIOGL|nr:uncharacterized protein LOC106061834 [Biomphalaria glabrata]KAI8766575.1 hypothetical protein BgiMline_004245 [Biomphalaria glabrata]